jgi:hypothetical protein
MKSPRDWAYPHLLGLGTWHLNLPSCGTVAYWLLPVQLEATSGVSAEEWAAILSYQIDMEGQAVEEADFYSNPMMPESIGPFSPVSMAKLWSPFPLAVDVLGEPLKAEISQQGEAVALWARRRVAVEIDERESDVSFFQTLLDRMLRLDISHDGLALIGRVGWSYDNADTFDRYQRKLMDRLKFVEKRRRI